VAAVSNHRACNCVPHVGGDRQMMCDAGTGRDKWLRTIDCACARRCQDAGVDKSGTETC
jgi:hypothetical protein